jgi:hypothetical protein
MKFICVKMVEARPMKGEEFRESYLGDMDDEFDEHDGYLIDENNGEKIYWEDKGVFDAMHLPVIESDGTTISEAMVKDFMGNATGQKIDPKTTLVKAITKTGFVQHHVSSCVDPANYDHKLGTKIGSDKIRGDLWKCMGFVLQWAKYGLTGNQPKITIIPEDTEQE